MKTNGRTHKPNIDLSGFHYRNWMAGNAEPPVIFNHDTDLHSCIAWAWGEVAEIEELAQAGIDAEDSREALLCMIQAKARAATAVLDELGERTRRNGITGAE